MIEMGIPYKSARFCGNVLIWMMLDATLSRMLCWDWRLAANVWVCAWSWLAPFDFFNSKSFFDCKENGRIIMLVAAWSWLAPFDFFNSKSFFDCKENGRIIMLKYYLAKIITPLARGVWM